MLRVWLQEKKFFFIKSTAIVAVSAVLKDCDILYADIL